MQTMIWLFVSQAFTQTAVKAPHLEPDGIKNEVCLRARGLPRTHQGNDKLLVKPSKSALGTPEPANALQ